MKSAAVIFLFVLLTGCAAAQPARNSKVDRWHGYERINFIIAGHNAYYVKPAKPLPGNPWIWRASFPDWHTDMDSVLLATGMYVAYISVDNEYGSAYSMQVWDKFYYYLTNSISLASKVSLEAVSRGGLYAYGWAKRHPDKVNCIYAEAPVCDIKSWPGGKNNGRGDSSSWKQLLAVFRFDEKEAMAFMDNPVDNLKKLASYKVPFINIVSDKDSIVPVKENTLLLAEHYSRYGGRVIIIPVTSGPQELYNHHFPIEGPEWLAGLITRFAAPVQKIASAGGSKMQDTRDNNHPANVKNKKASLSFMTGSQKEDKLWKDGICSYLVHQYPQTQFLFVAP